MVTSTAMASTLSMVRTGRWVRFAKISLFSTQPLVYRSRPRKYLLYDEDSNVGKLTFRLSSVARFRRHFWRIDLR
jgi:hypothetical protein